MSEPTLFAAPGAAAHGAATGGALEITLALLVVLSFVVALAWVARRMRRIGGGESGRIQVLASEAFGIKERCVLVRVGDTDILIGVAPGSVRALHVFAPGANTQAPPAPAPDVGRIPGFKELLMRSLGK